MPVFEEIKVLSSGFPLLAMFGYSRVRFHFFCRFKCPYSWGGVPFLFSGYFCSVDAFVFSIVSGRCYQSSSALFM